MAKEKDWVGGRTSTRVMLGVDKNWSKDSQEEHGFYATSPEAIDELFKVIEKPTEVWECACGAGHLSKRMRELGVKVYSSDLIDRGYGTPGIDFLAMCNLMAPVIITNPPYRYALEFVEHAIELGAERVCMFLKLTFLEGVKRQRLFQKYPPHIVAVFTKRIQVARNGDPEMFKKSSAACYAWFIWDKGYTGAPKITWVNKGE